MNRKKKNALYALLCLTPLMGLHADMHESLEQKIDETVAKKCILLKQCCPEKCLDKFNALNQTLNALKAPLLKTLKQEFKEVMCTSCRQHSPEVQGILDKSHHAISATERKMTELCSEMFEYLKKSKKTEELKAIIKEQRELQERCCLTNLCTARQKDPFALIFI